MEYQISLNNQLACSYKQSQKHVSKPQICCTDPIMDLSLLILRFRNDTQTQHNP